MKKSILPALLLTFMTTFYGAYSSSISEDFKDSKSISQLKKDFLDLKIETNSHNTNKQGIADELKCLQQGIKFLSSGDILSAQESFKNAIEYGEGSPLGYLYLGALEQHPQNRTRYLYIASLGAEQDSISSETYKTHKIILVKYGIMKMSEWRIKKN